MSLLIVLEVKVTLRLTTTAAVTAIAVRSLSSKHIFLCIYLLEHHAFICHSLIYIAAVQLKIFILFHFSVFHGVRIFIALVFLIIVIFLLFAILNIDVFFLFLSIWIDASCLVVFLFFNSCSAEFAVPLLYLIDLLLWFILQLCNALWMHPSIQRTFLITITAKVKVTLNCSFANTVQSKVLLFGEYNTLG